MVLYWPYLIADYYWLLEFMILVVSTIICISSVDDLFVDAVFYLRAVRRRLTIERRYKPLRAEQLLDRPEQHIAIMVPAWNESDVIAAMIEGVVHTLNYRNFTIFVGTYRNDASTIAEVERVSRRYRQLVRVEVPRDGPTCKADCLNWVVQAIFAHENRLGIVFSGAILHDCEDVLHPLELKFFNYLLPRIDLIQIPVTSLERNWYDLVAGVYMDDFAEWHSKDLVTRESLTGMVPSAGVGTCFSRKALLELSNDNQNEPFNTETLTEDYDIGIRLASRGMRSILARFPVEYTVLRKTWFGLGPDKELTFNMPLSVREYFPNTIFTSYRQKSRWALGIIFQGWAHLGWKGPLIDRYFLLRDRKAAFTIYATAIAFLLALQYAFFQAAFSFGILNLKYPPLLSFSGWIGILLTFNLISLVLRVIQRFYFTSRIFGWEHGLISIPRMIVGNLVNLLAISRAWKQYVSHLITGNRLVWDKTMHDFPSADSIGIQKAKLGEILLAWQAIDEIQLDEVLKSQEVIQKPVGNILLDRGWIGEETIAEAVAYQSGLEMTTIDDGDVLRAYKHFEPSFCFKMNVLAIFDGESDIMAIATSFPVSMENLQTIEKEIGYLPRQYIVLDRVVAQGLELIAKSINSAKKEARTSVRKVPLLGEILVEKGLLTSESLADALVDFNPSRHGQIGAFLVSRGLVFNQNVNEALKQQRSLMERWVADSGVDV